MGCTNCKKKKEITKSLKKRNTAIIDINKVFTWVFFAWFFLGLYGLWSLIEKIFHL